MFVCEVCGVPVSPWFKQNPPQKKNNNTNNTHLWASPSLISHPHGAVQPLGVDRDNAWRAVFFLARSAYHQAPCHTQPCQPANILALSWHVTTKHTTASRREKHRRTQEVMTSLEFWLNWGGSDPQRGDGLTETTPLLLRFAGSMASWMRRPTCAGTPSTSSVPSPNLRTEPRAVPGSGQRSQSFQLSSSDDNGTKVVSVLVVLFGGKQQTNRSSVLLRLMEV